MRWRLLVLVSLIVAMIAAGSWFLLITLFFNGSSSIVALNDQLWPSSLVVPLLLAIFAGVFVYRHTSRKRKTQALITGFGVLILTALICLAVLHLLRKRSGREIRISAAYAEVTSVAVSSFGPSPISFCTGLKESITNRM